MTRLPVPYETLDVLRETFARMDEVLADIPLALTAVLIDSRLAPARNDPAFEEVFTDLRRRFFRPFSRIGLLMQTAVGVLHSTRHGQMDGLEVCVSVDVRELSAYLGVDISPLEIELRD